MCVADTCVAYSLALRMQVVQSSEKQVNFYKTTQYDLPENTTVRKPAPVLLCPTQTSHAAWTRTRAAVVGSQGLTA
jgi:hypothetical protein